MVIVKINDHCRNPHVKSRKATESVPPNLSKEPRLLHSSVSKSVCPVTQAWPQLERALASSVYLSNERLPQCLGRDGRPAGPWVAAAPSPSSKTPCGACKWPHLAQRVFI